MLAFRIALARLRALFRRDGTADEIREEMDFHVAMRADEYAREGLDAAAARQAALRRFGNVAVIQDRGYDVRGGGVMETILQDVKYALRQLGRQPAFAILAGLTLALGIGVSTALFSVIDAALLRPLPYPHPEQLVTIDVEETSQTGTTVPFRAVDGGHSHLANAPGDPRPGRDGTGQQRIYAADRGHRHARPDDRRRSVGRLSRDLRHLPHPRPWHPRGRHSRRRSSRRLAGARLLAERIRRRSKRARPRHPCPGRPGHDRRRAAGRLLQGDCPLEGQAVQCGHDRSPRHGHSRDRAAARRRLTVAGAGSSRGGHDGRDAGRTDTTSGARRHRLDVRGRDPSVRRDHQHAVDGGWPHPDHRVRQRRRSAAGAGGDPARRAGHPRGDRRGARPAGPAAAHREPAAGAGRGRRGRAARLRVTRLAGRAHSVVAARQFAGGDQRDRARRSRSASRWRRRCSSDWCRPSSFRAHRR